MRKITIWLLSFVVAISSHLNAQTESFETTAVGSIPNGWVKYQSETDDPGFQVMDQTGYAHDGTKYLVHEGVDLAAESTSWVVSNVVHVGMDYELSFYWRGRWTSAYNFTAAYISTGSNDPVANPGDFTMLEEYSPTNFPNTWLQWNKAAYDLSSYANQNIYIAFKYTGDHAHDFFIDEVNVAPMPYCELPDNLEVDNRGMDFLDVSWDTVLGVTDYEVVWGAPGFDPNAAGNTPVLVSNATSYHIDGLTQSTPYDIYVRSVCSSYNHSPWDGPTTGVTVGPPPANDDCANAIDLTVYDYGASTGNETPGDTTNATDSNQHPSCDDIGTNLDVWYTFTVPAGETSVMVKTGGANGDQIEAALYDSCGGTELDCQNNSASKIFSGLTAGTTYTLQVWHDDFNASTFDIAIEKAPPGPANDDCDNAESLTVNPDDVCSVVTHGTTVNATASPQADDVTGTPNNDVWYTFVATNTSHIIKLINVTAIVGSSTDMGMGLYDGTSGCANLSLVQDSDPNTMMVSGLTVGTTYYLRVYGWSSSLTGQEFDVCVGTPPPPPSNDNCSNATALIVTNSCSPTTATNFSAADSGVTDPGCANYSGGDVWFSFQVPAAGSATIETSEITGSDLRDTGMAVYEGSCGSLNLIECDDDGGPGLFSQIILSGRTAGETLYVRVWEYGNDRFGQFGICVYDSSVSIAENDIEGLEFYPNPVSNTLNIQAKQNIQAVYIYNISGQEVVKMQPNATKQQIDMSHLSNGMYFVKVQVNGQLTAFKVVKK